VTTALDTRFRAAQDVAREAGLLARGFFADLGSLAIRSKGRQDVVTDADIAVENLIRSRLGALFPEDSFLGEESGADDSRRADGLWVVDPIDGTQEFSLGIRQWCVSIAFIVGNQMEIGIVYDPNAEELFAALSGHGATLNGRAIEVSSVGQLDEGVVALEYSNRTRAADLIHVLSALLDAGGTYARGGSGALALCYVACGRLLGFIELHMQSWDCLAALLLIREAGGRTNDFLNERSLLHGNLVVASPPQLYEAVTALLPKEFTAAAVPNG
jgi:myo-inositol-1(or 4)-monophosphatase